MRVLVLGAGVIGSVYAGKLLRAGHEVVVLARGHRLSDLQAHGLVLQDAESGDRTVLAVPVVNEVAVGDRYDLVLVAVRSEQVASTLPTLVAMTDGSDVLFFGNTTGRQPELTAALGHRALFGFPAAGGVLEGPVVRHVLISQQKTMVGEPNGTTTSRVRQFRDVLSEAGFSTRISANIGNWQLAHSAFIVPLAFALYRVGVDAGKIGGRPCHDAADGAGDPPGVRDAARSGEHRNPHQPTVPLPPAQRVRRRLLAAGPRQSSRRAVVRRAHPRRPRGNALSRRATKGCAAPQRTSHARRRPVAGRRSLRRRRG